MAKNKRQRKQNPQPFLADDDSVASTKKRAKTAKHHQKRDKMISSGMSSKILKEALLQQKELEEEASAGNVKNAFGSVEEEHTKHDDDDDDDDEDIDDFGGFSETQSQFGDYEEEIDEEDEKLLEAFLSKDARPERTLADIIIQKIKENDANVASETRPLPKLDESLIYLYKGVGKFLNKYTAGKIPKTFKHIPKMPLWEDILYLTEPENWSPNAMFQATRIFASNLGTEEAKRFYRFVLLPRVRDDIRKNKRLHFDLHQSLKKALYKPEAFNKGILFPLCKSGTCNLKEASIIGSILRKNQFPWKHSSAALVKLAEMEYCGTTSYFIKLLLEKKYGVPYPVVDAVVAHFMRFIEETRIMPVIWHQSLLAFVQRYKNALLKEDKNNLRRLLEVQKHKQITPEIIRELDNSRNRGEKEDDVMVLASPVSVINKTIEEDWYDIPDVPMEDEY